MTYKIPSTEPAVTKTAAPVPAANYSKTHLRQFKITQPSYAATLEADPTKRPQSSLYVELEPYDPSNDRTSTEMSKLHIPRFEDEADRIPVIGSAVSMVATLVTLYQHERHVQLQLSQAVLTEEERTAFETEHAAILAQFTAIHAGIQSLQGGE